MPVPVVLGMLHAVAVPPASALGGGETEFADMRAAYDALDFRTKTEVEDLVCEHSLIYSRAAIGFTDMIPEEIAAFKPVRQPLVRTHPETGRKCLLIGYHVVGIPGMADDESAALGAQHR